ncbi:replicative DNA helicase [Marinobacter nanhaiticus D15-8W]|uniref:Replicative DNA helicase n=1 Tax=Marinobacter nanhaiticus D15-8W TaxID=626887 RepID=N6X6Z7_9GAMM|nr:replicative DNA helicase [Marinobacter nanhaiticus]ENO16908.1 replicative DNA helicase [Marinobacter nanhaiticus D15-8W]BES72198.1 replicative DNA helicase [Marinobacter nanhaiticus D15-8W]
MSDFDFVESSVLGLAISPRHTAEVFALLSPEDFSSDLRPMAEAAYALFCEGKEVDAVTVSDHLESQGVVNASSLLMSIADNYGKATPEALKSHAEIIRERSLRRQLHRAILASGQILSTERPGAAQQRIMSEFEAIVTKQSDDSLWDMKRANTEFLQIMQRRNEAGGELIGLSTGFKHLDNRMNGMGEGDLIIVAGRPSMGKTTFALNIVEHNAVRAKVPCLVFSMEMSAPQLIEKMTASLGSISLGSIRRGTLTEEEWTNFSAASQLIKNAQLHIDDRGGLSVPQMRARAHEVKRKCGRVALIMVDYLQLMTANAENRTQEITKISGGLKALGKEFKCPVIALSQLNRSVESRADKRPMMSDLRESGAIEQDADAIIFPFREGYYENPDNPDPLTEIIFGKLRMGERGSEGLEFQGSYSRFKSLDGRPDFAGIRARKEAAEREAQQQSRKGRKGFAL